MQDGIGLSRKGREQAGGIGELPAETGASAMEKAEIFCSTLPSKSRKLSAFRLMMLRSIGSVTVTGICTIRASTRKLERGRLLAVAMGRARGTSVTGWAPAIPTAAETARKVRRKPERPICTPLRYPSDRSVKT
jgi:hypothetical protein